MQQQVNAPYLINNHAEGVSERVVDEPLTLAVGVIYMRWQADAIILGFRPFINETALFFLPY